MKINIHKKFGIVVLPVIFIVLLITILLSQQRQEFRQHAAGNSCNKTGVTKNQDGTYSFAPLHINTNGELVDINDCKIYLLGGQGKGVVVNNQSGSLYNLTTADFSYIPKLNQKVPMNVIRVPIFDNAWVLNMPVAGSRTPYQDFIKTYIKAIEGYGDYIELDFYFTQQSPSSTTDTTQAVQTLTGLATYFKGDPAVLYDIRNEGTDAYNATVISQNNQLIDAIDAVNPMAIKVVYDAGIRDVATGAVKVPFFYSQPNIIIDEHIYGGSYLKDSNGKVICNEPNKQTDGSSSYWVNILSSFQNTVIPYLHANHAGLIINEWGGTCNHPDYSSALAKFVTQNSVAGLNYFYPLIEWFAGTNPLGYDDSVLTNQAYTTIFGSPVSDTSPTITPSSNINGTRLLLTVGLHDIGNVGDNANPNGKGNLTPQHKDRLIKVTIDDTKGNTVETITGQVNYNAGLFTGSVLLQNVPTGSYLVTVKSDGFLEKQIPGIVQIQQNQSQSTTPVYLVNGDITNDNQIDIQDYNGLIGCYGAPQSNPNYNCVFPITAQSSGADINDDTQVNGADYNEFLRELSIQQGQ